MTTRTPVRRRQPRHYLVEILAGVALIGLTVVMIAFHPNQSTSSHPGTLSPPAQDRCRLLPPSLVERLVPAPRYDPAAMSTRVSAGRRSTAQCRVRTDAAQSPARQATLIVDDERYFGQIVTDAAAAQRDFSLTKQVHLGIGGSASYRVYDLAGLGESAYLAIEQPVTPSGHSRAAVFVLRDDEVMWVEFTASPSSDDLVAAAATTVARIVVGGA